MTFDIENVMIEQDNKSVKMTQKHQKCRMNYEIYMKTKNKIDKNYFNYNF